jgi:hypothetical protein
VTNTYTSQLQPQASNVDQEGNGTTHRIGIDFRIGARVLHVVGSAGGVDDAVDDGVRDVDALGAKLAGEGLGERARGELADGEGREVGRCFERGRGAREDQCWWVRWVSLRRFQQPWQYRL